MPLKTRFDRTKFKGECFFTALELPTEAKFTFLTVDLSRAQFTDTNLECIVFRDIKWASFSGRLALWDEFRQLEQELGRLRQELQRSNSTSAPAERSDNGRRASPPNGQ